MDFVDAIPVTFKEIAPSHSIPEKWKEITLNTGGTHSTLQDIKLPQKAGGYWYQDSGKANTRNRFIYWQTTSDAIELSEASLDINLSSCNLRCKVAPGTPPLNYMSVYERQLSSHIVILAATVSSVHRLIFPHPDVLDKRSTFGSMSTTSPSIFYDTSSVNNPNNYFILNQYSNSATGVAHSCSSLLRENGEAVFALAFGLGGDGGLLLVKLPVTGTAVTMILKRESTVPRFLSGITGALRGKTDSIDAYSTVMVQGMVVAICGDSCLRAWSMDEAGPPVALSQPLTQTAARPRVPPHGHMLQKATSLDGSIILVAHLSFPIECEFVVLKMLDGGAGSIRFSHICRIFGPQLDLLDYTVGSGEGSNVIWALWNQSDGETAITSSVIGPEVSWRAVAHSAPPPPLPQLSSHQQYQQRLFSPGLFPPAVIKKALVIYRRTWGNNETNSDGDLAETALQVVQARLRHLTARASTPDHSHLMHKCWSDLYSWCLQYMEGLQKPLGIMVSNGCSETDVGWWCGVIRRSGISLVRELEPLERMMLSPDISLLNNSGEEMAGALSTGALRVVAAGAAWEARGGLLELQRRLLPLGAPQHRLLPRLLHLLHDHPIRSISRALHSFMSGSDVDNGLPAASTLTPQQVNELTNILEPIKDLQSAVLELNDALRLDVPEIDTSKSEDEDTSEYDTLLASDLGVAIVTESIRQMAEMRSRVVGGALAALGARGGGVPGAGHCAVHWQAYRALLHLRAAAARPAPSNTNAYELFRLKLKVLGSEPAADLSPLFGQYGIVHAYASTAGGRKARLNLAAARVPTFWHQALPLMTYHLAHQLWAVSGGFDFGWWLASIYQPRLVQSYVVMLEPWCEWNACSRQFILGLALLDLDDTEGAYTAFCKAAKGVSNEPFLRQLISPSDDRLTQHQALVLYYMKVIKLFEIHDAGACVVRLAETAISIADKDDPNLAMFQWVVFKWHLAGGRTARALSAAAAAPPGQARIAAAHALLTTLASRKELSALVSCAALANEAEKAAASRAKLHDAHINNPYYDFLYALYISRHHYRKAAAVMYERAARCGAERGAERGAGAARRRLLAAALTCLRLAARPHAYIARHRPRPHPHPHHTRAPPHHVQVIGTEELERELREEDPDALDPIRKALLRSENVDFDELYPALKSADVESLSAVINRAVSTGQFLPRWFILRFMELDAPGCIRALLNGGRLLEAASACTEAIRSCLQTLQPTSPGAAPLHLTDLILAELEHHDNEPEYKQIYDDLNHVVKEYTQVVIRTSEDMKVAQIKYAIK